MTRYGRVGETGVSDAAVYSDASMAKKFYMKKFSDKTKPSKGYLPISVKTVDEKEVAA